LLNSNPLSNDDDTARSRAILTDTDANPEIYTCQRHQFQVGFINLF